MNLVILFLFVSNFDEKYEYNAINMCDLNKRRRTPFWFLSSDHDLVVTGFGRQVSSVSP